MADAPSATDLAYQAAFKVAHGLLRAYWWVRRPLKGGVLIAVWNAGEVLILKNTYRRPYTLPGGYPLQGETPATTGARELMEECGVHVPIAQIHEVYRKEFLFESRRDDVIIVEADLPERPFVRVDNREVGTAYFALPTDVLKLSIVPHLRDYLLHRGS
jgi:8-oxo-dGTP diphosphatase